MMKAMKWAVCAAAALLVQQAHADIAWNWSYVGAGISASGMLQTTDSADAAGFYEITAINGSRNGDAITGLFPAGSAIPGNEPYAIDNLIRVGDQGQITLEGFGFATASGGYANPYYADFLATPAYSEVFTTATSFDEVAITFTATRIPEPAVNALLVTGLAAMALATRRRRCAA